LASEDVYKGSIPTSEGAPANNDNNSNNNDNSNNNSTTNSTKYWLKTSA